MSLLRKRGEYQKLKHNKNIGQPFRRHAQLFEIASTAIAKVIDFRKGLSEVLISQTDDAVVLTWEVSKISTKILASGTTKYLKNIIKTLPSVDLFLAKPTISLKYTKKSN